MKKVLKHLPAFCATVFFLLILYMPIAAEGADVTIYALEDYAKAPCIIPAGQDFYQIPYRVVNITRYSVSEGDSVQVSPAGVVTPRPYTYYWYGDTGYSEKQGDAEPDRVTTTYHYGVSTIRIFEDSVPRYITVELKNYAEEYADFMMDMYITSYGVASRSEYDRMVYACKYVSAFGYSEDCCGITEMIAAGEGDCLAGSLVVCEFLRRVGISACVRDASKDEGAEANHRNVVAMTSDGRLYEIETGFKENAPRSYTITEKSTAFSYTVSANHQAELYSFDMPVSVSEVEIPSYVDGYKVTSLADGLFTGNKDIKKVVLNENLTQIGKTAFAGCTSLTEISVPGASEFFSAQGGVLYNKDKTVIYAAPAVKNISIAKTVQRIADYAFYRNDVLDTVVIPGSVMMIGYGAFGECASLKTITVTGKGLSLIGGRAFSGCTALENFYIPSSVKTIGENVFYPYTGFTQLKFGGTKNEWNASWSFYNKSGAVTVIYNALPYLDTKNTWYTEGVKALLETEIMTGLNATEFGPEVTMSRAMVATVLYRLAGSPEVDESWDLFPDVPRRATSWFYRPALWAKKYGVIGGYADGRMGCDDDIIRQDFIKMIYSYAKSIGMDVSVSSAASYKNRADWQNVSGYAIPMVNWGVEKGLIGVNSNINPKDNLTRAEAATIIKRFMDML